MSTVGFDLLSMLGFVDKNKMLQDGLEEIQFLPLTSGAALCIFVVTVVTFILTGAALFNIILQRYTNSDFTGHYSFCEQSVHGVRGGFKIFTVYPLPQLSPHDLVQHPCRSGFFHLCRTGLHAH